MDEYVKFMSSIFGADEVAVYTRILNIAEQVGLEQYDQDFGSIMFKADEADTCTLSQEWHSASLNIVNILFKGIGIFTTDEVPLSVLTDILEVVLDIENREDRSEIYYILEDTDLDNKEKLIKVIMYFSVIDEHDLLLAIDRVHNGCIRALIKLVDQNQEKYSDIEMPTVLPPLVKNVRLLIDDNPNFIILDELKSGLAVGQSIEHYLNVYWNKIEAMEPRAMLREMCAMILISNVQPHNMLNTLRKIFADKFEDLGTIKRANDIINEIFAPVLKHKVENQNAQT